MDSYEVIDFLEHTRLAELSELGVITTLKGFRRRRTGGSEEVTIEIHDRGAAAGPLRYSVTVQSECGATATGNPANDLKVALFGVHWNELDIEPDGGAL